MNLLPKDIQIKITDSTPLVIRLISWKYSSHETGQTIPRDEKNPSRKTKQIRNAKQITP
jgi:hypothetical protein